VPVFAESFDLEPALRLDSGESAIEVFPVFDGAIMRCTPTGLLLHELPGPWGDLLSGSREYQFEVVVFVEAKSGATTTPSASTCEGIVEMVEELPATPPSKAL
jgi:hypothetical protein